jgi:DNA-binding transcriptional MerR regulator
VPNERLVRWYVTVGLVDPPLSRRGRVARYGRRHLLQLVAVKRRQTEGRSLAEIQAELAGATDDVLAAVARVPDTWPAPGARPTARGRFWARQAGLAEPAAAALGTPMAAAERGKAVARAAERAEAPTTAAERGEAVASGAGGLVYGIRLGPGVTLLLDGADREPGPDDMAEIINAARPLLEELASRRLYADHLE